MHGLAYRRSTEERKKHRVQRYYGGWPKKTGVRATGKVAHSPQICSCEMCKNPRRSSWSKGKAKLTLQEIRHQLKEEEFDGDSGDT